MLEEEIVPDVVIVLPGEGNQPYQLLLSNPTLPDHARGRWELDAPDLPDSLREVHWHALICITAMSWLLDQGPNVDRSRLQLVLEDLYHSLRQGSDLLRKRDAEIHLAGRTAGLLVIGEVFPTATHAALRLACRCVKRATDEAGMKRVPAVVAAWPRIFDRLAPELTSDRAALSLLAEAVLRELRTVTAQTDGFPNNSPFVGKRREDRMTAILQALKDARMPLQGKALARAAGFRLNKKGRPNSDIWELFSEMVKNGLLEKTADGYVPTEMGTRIVQDCSTAHQSTT
jgi:hypothetical protein